MNKFGLPENILDKIYEIKTNEHDVILKIITYFPLSDYEKYTVQATLNERFLSNEFRSIFSDIIDDIQWNKSKDQIKKRFNDELFDIDSI